MSKTKKLIAAMLTALFCVILALSAAFAFNSETAKAERGEMEDFNYINGKDSDLYLGDDKFNS